MDAKTGEIITQQNIMAANAFSNDGVIVTSFDMIISVFMIKHE